MEDLNVDRLVKPSNEIRDLGAQLWEFTRRLEGWPTEPRMVSGQLYKRGWSNACCINLLWNQNFTTEAETILRSAVEVAICLANLRVRPQNFVDDLKSDAATTISGQRPIWTKANPALGDRASALSDIFGTREDGRTHKRFVWESLAKDAGRADLYDVHKHLSGTAAHVTGISLIHNVEGVDSSDAELVEQLLQIRRYGVLEMALLALGTSIEAHASIVGAHEILNAYQAWADLQFAQT